MPRLDALHYTWFKRPELDEKKPYEHLVNMSCHIRSAMQHWGVLPLSQGSEPSWSIRQVLIDRMPPQITYVPMLVTRARSSLPHASGSRDCPGCPLLATSHASFADSLASHSRL